MSTRFSRKPIKSSVTVGLVLLLWVGYTTLQTLSVVGLVREATSALLGFIPGILGVAVLLAAGLLCQDCFLQYKPLSRPGFAVLAATFVFALAAVLSVGEWHGWDWTAALLYAPASGVSQELFFRSALLPAVRLVLGKRARLALVGHSLLFGLWHIGPLFMGAPIWAVLAVMLVPFICGIGWGWQVERDRTVVWAMLQHSLIWVIGSQFPVPG
ncbi:MAG: CPBP family intramembrane metalloprotease [Anaerolineae bacterium]|jgi:membrane protease YdiL (CAAX protease family)